MAGAEELKAAGVQCIACLSVNDHYVMSEWGKAQGADKVVMLADEDAAYAKALGMTMDGTVLGGTR